MFDREAEETHPSFAMARVGKVAQSSPGASLFDSEIRHQHYVVLEISRASRQRELHRDWLFGRERLIEVAMSMAQWGALVSSFGTSGEPCTLTWFDGPVEEPPYAPRMAQSTREVENAAGDLVAELADTVAKLRAAHDSKAGRREIGELLHTLDAQVDNAKANARYTAKTFTEHVENVVTKAKYDIEAAVQMAAERGLEAGDSVRELLSSEGDR